MTSHLTNDEATVLEMVKTKCRDKRGWSYSTLYTKTKVRNIYEVVDSLVAKGLIWKSGPRQFGNSRRFRMPEDAE